MEENKEISCGCSGADYLVLSCSGASNLGYLCDQVARKMHRNNVRKMNCLTVVATGTDEKIDEFRNCNILVLDGCNEDCGKKIMASRSLKHYAYLRLTDLGFEKGKTPTTQEIVKEIYDKAEKLF